MSRESPYMTSAEAMVYLRLPSRSSLQRLITEHRLPYGRLGRRLIFDRRQIDSWVQNSGSLQYVTWKVS